MFSVRNTILPSTWTPLLPDDLLGPASEAICQVLNEVEADSSTWSSANLLCELGTVLGYWAQSGTQSSALKTRAVECVSTATDLLSDAPPMAGSVWSTGHVSLAWTIEHLSQLIGDESSSSGADDDPLVDVDRMLIRALESRQIVGYDLISGVVGTAVYFLERWPVETAKTGLGIILEILSEIAEVLPQGVAWRTPPSWMPEWQRELAPTGYHNLGVAHGIPGIMCVISNIRALGIEVPTCDYLLNSAFRWLRSCQRTSRNIGQFPNWIPDYGGSGGRVAWCYGDLGIAATFLANFQFHGDQSIAEWAVDLALCSAGVPPEKGGSLDACLCHGALGNAHMFSRCFQAAPLQEFRNAAVSWYRFGLQMWRKDARFAFLSHRGESSGSPSVSKWSSQYVAEPFLLSGGLGAALSLISATLPLDPGWDRRLLLSSRDWSREGFPRS